MRVLALFSIPPEVPGDGRLAGEFDLAPTAWAIAEALPNAEIATVRGEVDEILAQIERHRPDVVLNACEAPLGRPELEAHVAALLEWLGIPFTGNGSTTLALCSDKSRTKAVLARAGIAVPREGQYPCIVKPAREDGSVGIDRRSVCANAIEMEAACARIGGDAIVEEFLPGHEYVVSLWGYNRPDHSAIGSWKFEEGLALITYEAKWQRESADCAACRLHYEAPVPSALAGELTAIARAAWHAVGGRGYMRIDLRLDQDGTPRVIDVNPNPMLQGHIGMMGAVLEAGWTWQRFVRELITWARC